jgi:DinB superfamily
MEFSTDKTIEVLERTPAALYHLLNGLSPDWIMNNEGDETWSVFDVVGHLLYADQANWMIRAELILSGDADKQFKEFDRFAQFENSKGKTLEQLLNEFADARAASIKKLHSLDITQASLAQTGVHPVFGAVTLQQLLAAWVAHDLDHISQIARVMAKQYKEQTGPWVAFLKILK